MEYRPAESLKDVATELSELIQSGNMEYERKQELLGQLLYAPPDAIQKVNGVERSIDKGGKMVGIWKQEIKNGQSYFKRDREQQFEWHLWADIHEIGPKKDKKRVVLLGESVARGFLYDPYYNVAKELSAILENTRELKDVEIVDLARVSIVMDELLEVVRSCVALRPDAIVIFAGNNWVYSINDKEYDYEKIYKIYEERSYIGVKQFLEEELKKNVMSFMAGVNAAFTDRDLPVVFVVPEFNLKDWRSNYNEQILPWTKDGRITEWLSNKAIAERALANNEMEELGIAAKCMTELDPSNPYGYELSGIFHLHNHGLTQARECFELARDTILFNRSNNSMPRCVTAVRDTILTEACRYGIKVVNLPEIFKETFPGKIPGRSLFLDNCHLTLQGIKVAMRHTAQTLINAMTGRQIRMEDIKETDIIPTDYVQAIAHFCAAIYNSHYGQASEIIEYHCFKAIRFSPMIKDTMIKYMDFSTRRASTVFCKSFEELILSGEMKQYEGGFALRHPRGGKLMDVMLTEAIVNSLNSVGKETGGELKELRMKEHGIRVKDKVNLMESFYRQTSYHAFYLKSNSVVFQARTTESCFQFITGGDFSVSIQLVYRTPGRDYSEQKIGIYINGASLGSSGLETTKKWTTRLLLVDKGSLKNGVNELKISWPYTSEALQIGKSISAESFLQAVFPVLGEIHTLVVLG